MSAQNSYSPILELSTMTVSEIKNALKMRHLSVSGTKATCLARLREAYGYEVKARTLALGIGVPESMVNTDEPFNKHLINFVGLAVEGCYKGVPCEVITDKFLRWVVTDVYNFVLRYREIARTHR